MLCVHVLKSRKDHNLYTGSTNDLKKRLKEHNLGRVDSTIFRRHFELIYYESYKHIKMKKTLAKENII